MKEKETKLRNLIKSEGNSCGVVRDGDGKLLLEMMGRVVGGRSMKGLYQQTLPGKHIDVTQSLL